MRLLRVNHDVRRHSISPEGCLLPSPKPERRQSLLLADRRQSLRTASLQTSSMTSSLACRSSVDVARADIAARTRARAHSVANGASHATEETPDEVSSVLHRRTLLLLCTCGDNAHVTSAVICTAVLLAVVCSYFLRVLHA